MTNLTAVILAAGVGKRFKPIVTPKALIPFLGRPMIDWIVKDLQKVGVEKFIIVTNSKDLSSFSKLFNSANIKFTTQAKPTGMAQAVLSAKKSLTTKAILVLNANDLLSEKTYQKFLNSIKKTPDKPTVTGLKTKSYKPGGYFKLKGIRPVGIIEKPTVDKLPSAYFNLVLHYFPQVNDFFSLLLTTKSKADDVYEQALNQMMLKFDFNLVKTDGYFAQLKYPHQILDATNLFLTHRLAKKDAVHPSAKIMAGATIKNSYIGQNVVVGNNALVRDSIVEAGSVIGYSTEIARSYIGPNNWFHSNYVGDSIIEADSNLGSGARLANLRFDEKAIGDTNRSKFGAVIAKGAKLGINASLMPGVTVGEKSIVGSGVVLTENIPAKSNVYLKQS